MSSVHCSIESDSEDNPTLLDQRGEDIQHFRQANQLDISFNAVPATAPLERLL